MIPVAAVAGRQRIAARGLQAMVVAMLSTMVLVVLGTPAYAHGRGSDATNFDSQVTAEPRIPGASWAIHGGDELLELSSTQVEVTVLGYSGEPYLRVGPDGVYENRNSPAAYLNEDRYRVQLPTDATADPEAAPEWQRRSSGSSHAWHDHRVHLMTTTLPADIAEDPSTPHLVQEWSVPVVVDGAQLEVDGELRWVPGPSPWPWTLAGIAVCLMALVGVRSADPQRLLRPAAVVLAAVVALNAARVVDDVAALPIPVAEAGFAAVQTALFLLIGALCAVKAWRGGDGAATALAIGAAAMLVGQGLLYLSVLSASQLTTLFPDALSRFTAAVSLGQALPVGAVAVLANRRMLPPVEEDDSAVARV